jgi:biopolymer transport protein ExbD
MAKSRNEDVSLDMTPMIDVVFQLIIFFVVTLKMSDDKDSTIKLADGANGIVLTQEELPPSQLMIDVAKTGRVSISNVDMSKEQIQAAVRKRVAAYGADFPCLIRADKATPHNKVAKVMDWCAEAGMWKISFVAIQQHKANDKGKKK